jgi:hypothetical protein
MSRNADQVFGDQCGRSQIDFIGAPINVREFCGDVTQLREIGPSRPAARSGPLPYGKGTRFP